MRSLFLLGIAIIGLTAHLGSQSISANPPLKTVLLKVGSVSFSAEVARTPRELAQGLMFRNRLSDNSGMIFCLLAEERASFWMKNVSLPLSVAYLDRKGVILEILDMKPFDETSMLSQSDKVYYGLEMNQGWFKLNQVKVGDRVEVEGKSLESLRDSKTVVTKVR
jgi:uncharacterized protein